MVRGEEGHAVWGTQGQHTNHRAETVLCTSIQGHGRGGAC